LLRFFSFRLRCVLFVCFCVFVHLSIRLHSTCRHVDFERKTADIAGRDEDI
jgi:hypothetical protein